MRRRKPVKKMSGYIKIQRAIERHWIWLDSRHLQWWLQLLFMAAWEPKQFTFGNTTIDLKRGQIATTTRVLAKRFICSKQTVHNFLAVLENHNMIVKESNKKMTIITIVNYEHYQQDSTSSVMPETTQKPIVPKHKLDHKVGQIVGQIKEEKKEEEKNIINSSSPSREQDLNFFEELKISEVFFEQCAMTLHTEISALKELFQQFSAEMLLQEKFHNSSADYRQHFFNWVKIQLNKGPRPNSNGTGKKETANKHEARRGTDVGNHTEDDFGGPF